MNRSAPTEICPTGWVRRATKAGLLLGSVTALSAGYLALINRASDYQREVRDLSFITGRSQQDTEAFTRALVVLGATFDDARDAALDFRERIGEARTDPNSEIARSFKDVGFDVNNTNLRLEDYLGLLSRIPDRQVALFEARTILGDTGARLLPLLAQGDLHGTIEAQMNLTLDDAASQDLIDAGQDYRQASQEFNAAVDKWLARGLPALTAILEDFFVGEATLAAGVRGDAERVGAIAAQGTSASFQELGPFQALGPPDLRPSTAQFGGGTFPSTSIGAFARGTRDSFAAQTPADPYNPSFAARAGAIESRRYRGVLSAGLQPVGPGLTLAGPVAGVSATEDPAVSALQELQVSLASSHDELVGIHFSLAEFLPQIANNTLSAVSAGSLLAANPTSLVNIANFGAATVRLLTSIFRQGEDSPVRSRAAEVLLETAQGGPGTEGPPEGLPPGLSGAGKPTVPALLDFVIDDSTSVEDILSLLGDEGLIGEYERLQTIAVEAWERIQEQTSDEAEQVRLFDEFMNTSFAPSWDQFGDQVEEVWNRNRDSLGLNQEQIAAFDAFITGTLHPDIDAFGQTMVEAWNRSSEGIESTNINLSLIEAFLGTSLPDATATFESGIVSALTSAQAENETLNLALDQLYTTFTERAPESVENLELTRQALAALGLSAEEVDAVIALMMQEPGEQRPKTEAEIELTRQKLEALGLSAAEVEAVLMLMMQEPGEQRDATLAALAGVSSGIGGIGQRAVFAHAQIRLIGSALDALPRHTQVVVETIRRTVYEEVGSPSLFDPRDHPAFGIGGRSGFDPRDHPAFGLTPSNPQSFHPVGSGRGPFPLGSPSPGAFDPRNHPRQRFPRRRKIFSRSP